MLDVPIRKTTPMEKGISLVRNWMVETWNAEVVLYDSVRNIITMSVFKIHIFENLWQFKIGRGKIIDYCILTFPNSFSFL